MIEKRKKRNGDPEWWIVRDGLEDYGPYRHRLAAQAMDDALKVFVEVFEEQRRGNNQRDDG